MNRRGTGVLFCGIAALLFAARYISAAIFGSGVSFWDARLFNHMLDYMGNGLIIGSVISLLVGVAYLIWAEIKKE
jgi:hypothetical protein